MSLSAKLLILLSMDRSLAATAAKEKHEDKDGDADGPAHQRPVDPSVWFLIAGTGRPPPNYGSLLRRARDRNEQDLAKKAFEKHLEQETKKLKQLEKSMNQGNKAGLRGWYRKQNQEPKEKEAAAVSGGSNSREGEGENNGGNGNGEGENRGSNGEGENNGGNGNGEGENRGSNGEGENNGGNGEGENRGGDVNGGQM